VSIGELKRHLRKQGIEVRDDNEASTLEIEALAWEKQDGLLPAVVQDADTLRILMLGYMDRAALQATLDTGRVTFHSRSGSGCGPRARRPETTWPW
jgi:hypothetical protein